MINFSKALAVAAYFAKYQTIEEDEIKEKINDIITIMNTHAQILATDQNWIYIHINWHWLGYQRIRHEFAISLNISSEMYI